MSRKALVSLLCALLLALALAVPASANAAAPNPVLTIKLKNAPAGTYTVVLIDEGGEEYVRSDVPEPGVWTFSGMELPRSFCVAITADEGRNVGPLFQREAYYTTLVYDCAAAKITYTTPVWLAYLVQFLCTCIPTLLIEGAVLILFRFDWRKNWKLFLAVNLITQILLTAAMAGHYIAQGERAYPGLLLIFAEIPIFLAETLVYGKWLKGHTRIRREAYGLTANLASLLFGLAANSAVFSLLQRL